MNYNRVTIAGRLTADPQLKKTPSGQSVLAVGVATNHIWFAKDGAKQESVEFHNVVIFGKTADNAATFLVRGQVVLIEGRLQTRTWEDKDGVTRKSTEIIAEKVEFGQKPASAPSLPPKSKAAPELAPEEVISLDEDENASRTLTPLFADNQEIKPEEIPF